MTDAIRKHLLKYPHARSTTLAYEQMKADRIAELNAYNRSQRWRRLFARILSLVWRRG
jgi:hypothetical protein